MMLPPEPDRWTIDLANAQRMEAIAAFGFTERQARFLLNVLLHSGVFVERQYCSFAGIVHGQKSTDFIMTLVERRYATPEWEHVYCAAIVAANTSMRPVEVKHLRRCDIDLVKRLVHIRRSKNETSHRVIPLNASAVEAAARMFERADLLGHTEPEHYLWPACQWGRYDATKPMLKWDTAWRALRDEAGLHGLRFHDLRQHAGSRIMPGSAWEGCLSRR